MKTFKELLHDNMLTDGDEISDENIVIIDKLSDKLQLAIIDTFVTFHGTILLLQHPGNTNYTRLSAADLKVIQEIAIDLRWIDFKDDHISIGLK